MISPNQRIYKHKETGRIHVETVNNEASLTQQQFKDECDINNIIKKFDKTGELTHLSRKRGVYGDFSNLSSYEESLQTVLRAEESFAELPPDVRKRFRNDPGELISFLADEKNFDEAKKLGLLNENAQSKLQSNQNSQNSTSIKQSSSSVDSEETPDQPN